MQADALAPIYPGWARVLAGTAAALIVLMSVGFILLALFGFEPGGPNGGHEDLDPYSYDDSAYTGETMHWFELLGMPFLFLSALYPLLWFAR